MSSSPVSSQQQQNHQQIIQSVGSADEMTSLNLVQTKSSSSNSHNHTHTHTHAHTASNSPRPELTTMTNVNVLDLQMNAAQSASVLSRNGDEDDHKKDSHSENYDDNGSMSNW